ncbi:MAG: hypothetical protein ACFCVF_11560 [Kineosporiaceae bacterium]
MAATSETQIDELRALVRDLSTEAIRVADVEVEEVDGPDGVTMRVTVVLATPEPGLAWDPDQFLEIRRRARTLALEVLQGRDVSLVYEPDSSSGGGEDSDDGDAEESDSVGGKNPHEAE